MRPRTTGTCPAAPDLSSLHEAALAHLARYATTRASLTAVLDRRIRRWATRASTDDPERVAAQAASLRDAVRGLVARLAESGLVDDRAFAEGRTRRLVRAGSSRAAILGHLAARGVDRAMAEEILPRDETTELLAALAFARRRRCGPFRKADEDGIDGSSSDRALAAFARAGFRHDVARRALAMDKDEAITRLGTTDPARV